MLFSFPLFALQVFKDSAGVGDSLEQAARNGFLAKKDFLERCDARAFEQERDARLKKMDGR